MLAQCQSNCHKLKLLKKTIVLQEKRLWYYRNKPRIQAYKAEQYKQKVRSGIKQ